MEEKDDLEALLGEIELNPPTKEVQKNELSKDFSKEELKNDILNELHQTALQSNNALNSVLSELAMTPGDPAVITAASTLMTAHLKVINEMQKLYALHEKHQQNKELLTMRLMTDHKINQENNQTKIMLTREQVIKKAKNKHFNSTKDDKGDDDDDVIIDCGS